MPPCERCERTWNRVAGTGATSRSSTLTPAAFSPAITEGDLVFGDVDALGDQPVGLWCGTDDGFVDAVRALGDALPVPADPEVYAQGRHTRVFWNDHTLEAFNALAGWLRADR